MNEIVNDASVNAASSQNNLYQVTVVEVPGESTDGIFVVKSEIKTPSGQFIPVTTTHINGQDANGVIDDAANGSKIDVRAKCIGANCEKYILLFTVVVNQQAVHQIAIISYNYQTYFNMEHVNKAVTSNFYRTLDQVVQRNGDRYK